MKKFARFLFDTWYGAAVAFAVSLAGCFAGVAFSCLAIGEAVAHVFGLFLALSAVALVAAFARSLWKRAWGRAAAQFGWFVLGQVAFFYEKACQEPFVRDELLLPSDALNLASIRTLGGRRVLVVRCTVGSI